MLQRSPSHGWRDVGRGGWFVIHSRGTITILLNTAAIHRLTCVSNMQWCMYTHTYACMRAPNFQEMNLISLTVFQLVLHTILIEIAKISGQLATSVSWIQLSRC